ncbi:uncharacterized protein LOC125241890 isoform X1 [Leguminivora glycinivorella]|uniref:uncharacterized protein LOC125241890 isoform X1 n=1 Tax=Leguminivora glycinivorella TaxID=1035111 RepID=UPI0020105ED9|nr:uncharacterized protein LOC125241890 isoform X1 [Leguminivora glycinivorella]
MLLVQTTIILLLITSVCFGQRGRMTRTAPAEKHTVKRKKYTTPTTEALGFIYYNKAGVRQWQQAYFSPPIDEAILLPPLEKIQNCDDCPRIHIPVCATNRMTYTNLCYLNCAARLSNKPKIKLLHMNSCFTWLDAYDDIIMKR